MIGDFHFLRPWWLLAIIIAGVLVWLVNRRSDVRSRWKGLIAPHLLDHLITDGQNRKRLQPASMIAALMVLGAIAVAGPTWQRQQPPFVEDKAPLALVIDLSQTMDAVDITPSRLERVKLKIRDILALRPGARTAVFAYAGSAHMVLPLTDDAKLIQTYVNSLATRIMPVQGKDTAKALQFVEQNLGQDEVPGTLLFLTDGIEASALDAFKNHSGNNEIMVLAVGTPEGGPVRSGEGQYLTSASGARVIARLDVDQLKAFKHEAGVQLATVTLDDSDVQWIASRIQTHLQSKLADGEAVWLDAGWWLLIPIVLLSAFWFRRGWSIHWTGALLLGFALAHPGRAEAAEFNFADMWLTRDQQARRAFEKGDYQGAAALFQNPMWLGTALYRAGRFGDAADAFAKVNTPESYYNQGNALAQMDKPEEAAASYREALKLRPDWPLAQRNLEIVEKIIADRKKEDEEEKAEDPNLPPDQVQFDEKGKQGKRGEINLAQQTAEMWMRNIQITPTDMLARKFAIEAQGVAHP
ncbi:MAG: VWA domain-containing protein [Phyllobacterium sp.]